MTDDKPSAKNMENLMYSDGIGQLGFRSDPKQTLMVDEGYCGLSPLTTGKRDPYWPRCAGHDVHYEKLKAGNPDKSNMQVQAEFAKGVLSTAASGLYAFLTAPIYLVIGCIGGMARWTQLEYRNMKARGEKRPSNTPED